MEASRVSIERSEERSEMMTIELLYFADCPNWQVTDERLREALRLAGRDDEVEYRTVETEAQAEAVGFAGSPTVLVDGRDPFADPSGEPAAAGLSCRVYWTPAGLAGAPTVEQLVAAIGAGRAT